MFSCTPSFHNKLVIKWHFEMIFMLDMQSGSQYQSMIRTQEAKEKERIRDDDFFSELLNSRTYNFNTTEELFKEVDQMRSSSYVKK
jgi:hypothetical protein